MRQVRIVFAFVAAAALAACNPSAPTGPGGHGDDDDSPGTPDAGDPNNGFIDATPFMDSGPISDGGGDNGACDKIDILFVVDNSASMEDEQAALIAAFPDFIHKIATYQVPGAGNLDYRVAITTTDITYSEDTIFGPIPQMWNDGKFVTGNCPGWPAGREYLQRGDNNVESVFACAANVGTNGSGLEMPLEAMKESLIDRIPNPNGDFLRQDALLAVVFLTDENDCSEPNMVVNTLGGDPCTTNTLEAVPNYITKLDTLKGGHGRWATAIIAVPVGAGSCAGTGSSENVRLNAFAQGNAPNAVFTSICQGNLTDSLTQAFDTFRLACENIPPVN